MGKRTREQILDQVVYAIQCVSIHYGPGFSEEGLREVRKLMDKLSWWTDASYQTDVDETDPFVDFNKRIVWSGWTKPNFKEIVEESKSE